MIARNTGHKPLQRPIFRGENYKGAAADELCFQRQFEAPDSDNNDDSAVVYIRGVQWDRRVGHAAAHRALRKLDRLRRIREIGIRGSTLAMTCFPHFGHVGIVSAWLRKRPPHVVPHLFLLMNFVVSYRRNTMATIRLVSLRSR